MTPSARLQAAVEIVDAVITAAREGGAAADVLVQRYFAGRRYAGSKDRRAVRELVFAAIRRAGAMPVSGRAALLGLAEDQPDLLALFDGSSHGPAPVQPGEARAPAGVAPVWLVDALAAADLDGADQAALVARAPLDMRVNTLRADPSAVRAEVGGKGVPGLPNAFRLPTGTALERHPLYLSGAIEVQDAGSQYIAAAVEARPGQTVVDLCAGAGGKTLALAAAMAGEGRLIACDVDRSRLAQLGPRAERAGATVETRLLDPGHEAAALVGFAADAVLVDAPCSGTGTWRRNPEARWRLTPARLERLVATQAHVLDVGASLVRPGGVLVYAVCSVLNVEGRDRAATFSRAGWTPEPLPFGTPRGDGVRLTPASHGTDGFFVARWRRAC